MMNILSNNKMKKDIEKEELKALKTELRKLKKENQKLIEKVEKMNVEKKELKKELKKNGAPRITLSKKQQQLLSNLSKGTNIQNSSPG